LSYLSVTVQLIEVARKVAAQEFDEGVVVAANGCAGGYGHWRIRRNYGVLFQPRNRYSGGLSTYSVLHSDSFYEQFPLYKRGQKS